MAHHACAAFICGFASHRQNVERNAGAGFLVRYFARFFRPLDRNAAPAWPERPMIWMKRQQLQKSMEYPDVVQVRLRGHCQAEVTTDWQFADGPLGWVYMTKEGIQPIAYVNCDRIGQTLEREFRGMSFRERQRKFARAISRVVAHELTHIFTQRAKHSSGGLQRAYLTAGELTKEGLL